MKLKIIRHHICDKIILSNGISAVMLSEDGLFHTTAFGSDAHSMLDGE